MSPSPTLLPQTRSGRTFLIAACLLGALGMAQVVALGWHLAAGSSRPRPAELPALLARETEPPPFAALTPPPGTSAKAASTPPATATLPQITLVPAPAPAFAATPPPRPQVNPRDLLGQARQLRIRGDMRNALARLREAQVSEPNNADIIAEIATCYEQMSQLERAIEQWQRIYDMGEAAGPAFQLAEIKLRTGIAGPPPSVREKRETDPTGANAANPERETKVGIVDVSLAEIQDPTAEKRLSLKITLKTRPGRYVDSNKVAIQAYFYDLVDGRTVTLTNAETASEWLTNPNAWDEATSQVLEAVYFRPKVTAAPVPTPPKARPKRGPKGVPSNEPPVPEFADTAAAGGEKREYAGYIVRVYYDRELQDLRAEPKALLEQFPAEQVLGTE
ncbi:MAG: hypothetical protein JSR82_20355 [Verrucomicrobia bacterium]|nr:hypothetical protein [Verrucomicrobiota bacterium]